MTSRPADEPDDEIQRLRANVGEITMNNERLLSGATAEAYPSFSVSHPVSAEPAGE